MAVKSAGAVIFSRIAVYLTNLLGVIVLARFVAPEDFGLVAMITAPFMIFLDFGNIGLSESTVQEENINHNQISNLFWINFGISAILTCILIIIAPMIADFYGECKLQAITVAIAITFVLSGLSTQHLALLRRHLFYYRISLLQILSSIISVTVSIFLAVKDFGYWAIVFRQITFSFSTTLGAWILCGWRPSFPSFNTNIRPMINFGLSYLMGNTIYYFSKNIDKVLIGWKLGSGPLGYYDRAFHLFAMPMNQLLFPLGNVAFSALSRLANDLNSYKHYYLKSLSLLAFVGMPFGVLLYLTADDLVLLILGPNWKSSGTILSIMSLSIGVNLIYMTFGWLNLSLGNANKNFRWILISAAFSTITFFFSINFGIMGITIAFTILPYLLIIPGLGYAGKSIDLKFATIFKTTWKYFLAAYTSGAIIFTLKHQFSEPLYVLNHPNVFFRVTSCSVAYIISYCLTIVVFFGGIMPIKDFSKILFRMFPQARKL